MIAVHAGAGYHSPALEAAYKQDLAAACRAGAAALAAGGSALEAVTAAIRVLEASSHCNAGRGSNLSFNGVVECDASVMAGDGAFGAVAAAPGIEHPVEAAALLAREGKQPLSYGRVRPMVLAGDRAREWALSRGLAAAATPQEATSMHLTEHTQRQWRKYRRIVDGTSSDEGSRSAQARPRASPGGSPAALARQQAAGWAVPGQQMRRQGPQGQPEQQQPAAGRPAKRSRQQSSLQGDGEKVQQGRQRAAPPVAPNESAAWLYDTVGCVALAPDGGVAAGVSSGGIVLKVEGRVGEAAVYGAGCWAQQPGCPGGTPGSPAAAGQAPAGPLLACSVTGVGERVMQHLLARELCQAAATAGTAGAPADGSQEGQEGSPEPAEPALDEVAAALLCRTILLGPPPHDCGLLCLRVQPLGGSGSSSSGGSGAGCRAGGGPALAGQPLQRHKAAVEVAVAHSAQSMAFGHMSCIAPAAPSTSNGASAGNSKAAAAGAATLLAPAPSMHILRRPAGPAAPPVQTYLHGTTLHL